MQRTINPDRNYCTFDGVTLYEFVPLDNERMPIPCSRCAFNSATPSYNITFECSSVPCDALHRGDKKNGFWRISQLSVNQIFPNLPQSGG